MGVLGDASWIINGEMMQVEVAPRIWNEMSYTDKKQLALQVFCEHLPDNGQGSIILVDRNTHDKLMSVIKGNIW